MQNKISGWALGLNGKFWGLIYSDGHSSEEGWTDDIDKIKVQNYMLKHFNERIEVYRDQGWFINEKNYEL